MTFPLKKSLIPKITVPKKTEKFISSFNELSSWQYRLLCGGASVGIQYGIESNNNKVDETTRKISTIRTTTKLTIGTISGVLTRYFAEKWGEKWFKKNIKKQKILQGSEKQINNWLKTKQTDQFRNYHLSSDGQLYKKEFLQNTSEYAIKKYDFKKIQPDRKILKELLVKNIDLIEKLPKAFGNFLAVVATIAVAIAVEPSVTDRILNKIMNLKSKVKYDKSV